MKIQWPDKARNFKRAFYTGSLDYTLARQYPRINHYAHDEGFTLYFSPFYGFRRPQLVAVSIQDGWGYYVRFRRKETA